jgi:hypothetical protein
MTDAIHQAATHHLPSFITAPGQTDVLMVVMAVILALSVLGFGIFFLRLHTLPERIAHKTHKVQFEIVAILGLIALFTHMHIFWIAGLLLAFIELPDFGTSLNRIADSAEAIAGIKPDESAVEPPEVRSGIKEAAEQARAGLDTVRSKQGDGAPGLVNNTRNRKKGLTHA